MARKRRNKFNTAKAQDRTWRDVVYDSKSEMRYAQVLDQLLKLGEIAAVERQPVVVMTDAKIKYIADFLVTYNDGSKAWIDVKGMQTAAFRLKLRLWKKYGPGTLKLVQYTSTSAVTGIHKFKHLGDYGPGVAA